MVQRVKDNLENFHDQKFGPGEKLVKNHNWISIERGSKFGLRNILYGA